MLQGGRDVIKHHHGLTGQQVHQRRGTSLVRDMHHVQPGEILEHFSRHVNAGAAAARCEVDFPRFGLGHCDNFLDRVGFHPRVQHQHVIERDQRHHASQVLTRIKRHFGVQRRIDRLNATGRHKQRIAIRR